MAGPGLPKAHIYCPCEHCPTYLMSELCVHPMEPSDGQPNVLISQSASCASRPVHSMLRSHIGPRPAPYFFDTC